MEQVKVSRFLAVLVGIFVLCVEIEANAQIPIDYSICAAPLKKDIIVRVNSQDEAYTYISMIDEQTYELLKHDVDTNASIPIPSLGRSSVSQSNRT
jgi:hypothetical protein